MEPRHQFRLYSRVQTGVYDFSNGPGLLYEKGYGVARVLRRGFIGTVKRQFRASRTPGAQFSADFRPEPGNGPGRSSAVPEYRRSRFEREEE